MSPIMKELGIDRLTPSQRVELALEIWDSLEGDRPPVTLPDSVRDELRRRDAELECNPSLAVGWEEIRSGLEQEG